MNSGGQFSDYKIGNQLAPKEGPKAIPVLLPFTNAVTLVPIDLTTQQYQARFSMCQTLYIDLSGTDSSLTVLVENINQTIIAKGRTQGYYPVLAPAPTKLDFSSAAAQNVPVVLINVPIAGAVWPSQ